MLLTEQSLQQMMFYTHLRIQAWPSAEFVPRVSAELSEVK